MCLPPLLLQAVLDLIVLHLMSMFNPSTKWKGQTNKQTPQSSDFTCHVGRHFCRQQKHCDAVGLTQEVLDAELWKYHSKKIRLENGISLHTAREYHDQMSHLKVIISIAKQLYSIFPRTGMTHGDSVQKHVTEAASKLIKSGDYLWLPDSSEVKGILTRFCETELEEMLKEWAESGMMNGLHNDLDSGSAEEDVNIII
ncbi:hypothetical protein DFH29DRAFT_870869 [Suillus ampliporus]|nr:hypothetical protein DFH29DRAFT_870869 [Suillus ampliporus]